MNRAPDPVVQIAAVRSEYTSARLICANLEHRLAGRRYERAPGYLSAEIDYRTTGDPLTTIEVRDYDVRLLDRVSGDRATAHVDRIHRARLGDATARAQLDTIARDLHAELAPRFLKSDLIENEYVIPYTTEHEYPPSQISDKGSILLRLSRLGFATPDFNLLAAGVSELDTEGRRVCARAALHNLGKLCGRRFGDPRNPLLIAMRSAMPQYLPGFMPTYLNVGLTPDLLPGLPSRYGEEATARIRLNNRRTILDALDAEASSILEPDIRPGLSQAENNALTEHIEELIARRDPLLLVDPFHQVEFFLEQIYDYYDNNLDALRNFMGEETYRPTVILQRMVCSVIDDDSYAGVLYSRHSRRGAGVHLQYARTIYGEDLMTGRLSPQEVHLLDPEDARRDFPAVHHFWRRLPQLERIFAGPVMVEFTGVHGTFTILQVNEAELSGVGMLTAVMNLYRDGAVDAARVRELIKPYHVRQLESDTIDAASLAGLKPFCSGISVLPRSAVTGRIYFSSDRVGHRDRTPTGENVILVKSRFTPTDAITMQTVGGICSLSPAAIHVVTTAQTRGVPALLNLEQDGVRLGPDGHSLVNTEGMVLHEGDWVTLSSRQKTLYAGKAIFVPARLMRFMEGEPVELQPGERDVFETLAEYYREYRQLLETVGAEDFESLQDLGQAVRSGKLRNDPEEAVAFVNHCFDVNSEQLVSRLFETTLGMHLSNQTAYRLLTPERRVALLQATIRAARAQGRNGYEAGAFVIGCLVEPGAASDVWQQFAPDEVAFLVNEWVLHQKYQEILSDVGERKLNLARGVILSQGLGELRVHVGLVREFLPLKLSGVDLEQVAQALPVGADRQTGEVVELLRRPFGEFFDFERRDAVARLERLCRTHGREVPGPDDR